MPALLRTILTAEDQNAGSHGIALPLKNLSDIAASSNFGNVFVQRSLFCAYYDHGLTKNAIIREAYLYIPAAQNSDTSAVTVEIVPFATLTAWPELAHTAWRISASEDFAVQVRDTGAALLVDTQPAANNSFWEIRYFGTSHDRLGQRFTPGSTANLGEVRWELSKVNAPGGDLYCEVYSTVTGEQGALIPNALLATSSTVAASAVATSAGDITFTFPGGQQPSLVSGTQYVAVLRSTTTVGIFNHIRAHSNITFGNSGQAMVYGTGRAFGRQNYPSEETLFSELISGVPTVVTWSVPTFVRGGLYKSPNIAAVIQACIDNVNWNPGLPLGFALRSVGSVGFRTALKPSLLGNAPFHAQQLEIFYINKSVANVQTTSVDSTTSATVT